MSGPSPAERYAASRAKRPAPLLDLFQTGLDFSLDPFQLEACGSLEHGRSVLVAAPTGAGKTVVAEFAVHLTMRDPHAKLFYTTPIKALSNQKYTELVQRYGSGEVGLLTGDTSVHPEGRIVVMTTEVLRNMLYANSELLDGLAFVVMDEVHYLADRFRGAVWEEVIIHLPSEVRLVSLSATVSNAEEFGQWLQTVRGDTDIIVSEQRPTPLYHHVLIGSRLVDLFSDGDARGGRVHPELTTLARSGSGRRHTGRGGRGRGKNHRRGQHVSRRPGRLEMLDELDKHDMLPAICFIFSRSGCDAAVEQLARAGVFLTNDREREEIRWTVEERTSGLPGEDLAVLGYWNWLDTLERGVAAHHAGMLPVFKEIVEELFQRKLLKIVFATETLALGINMPARTVVLERLDKFNGESRVPVTPGEFTQLTGRAGRRGIDDEGHALVIWRDGMHPQSVANLASRRSYPLNSSFRPSYNMTVNLIARFGRERTRTVLESSFAQFQADRAVVSLARRVAEQQRALEGYREAFACHLGDFMDYSAIRRELSDVERARVPRSHSMREERQAQLATLRDRLRRHACHLCPQREDHARWAERYWRLARETNELEQQIETRTGAVARLFDRLAGLLIKHGYIAGNEEGHLSLTQAGSMLARIYGERDLLIAECLRSGAWDELDAPGLAAMIAVICHEPRREEDELPEYRLPKGSFREAVTRTQRIAEKMTEWERECDIPSAAPLSLGLVPAMHLWARGGRLDLVLERAGMQAGDFVRSGKMVLDVLDQIAQLHAGTVSETARQAVKLVRRGIVANSAGEAE